MNPYLRVIQPIRPSTFFYAKEMLEGNWPEMEPKSGTRPTPHVELLEEDPIGPKKPTAKAIIGLFFDNELTAKAITRKWLLVDNHFFLYGSYSQAGAISPHQHEPPKGGEWQWEEGWHWWEHEDTTNEVLDMWTDIGNMLVDEIDAWEPPPPTSIESANQPIRSALTRSTESFVVDLPDQLAYLPPEDKGIEFRNPENRSIGIVYAIWTAPFPGRKAPFPIFALQHERVDRSGSTIHRTESQTLYFDAEEAVLAAVVALERYTKITFPADYNLLPTMNRLENEVESVLHGD